FVSERGGPISPIGFHRLVQRLGEAAKMPFPIHPPMLRHACGVKLANDGPDTRALPPHLGHKKNQHTLRDTETAPDPVKSFLEGLTMAGEPSKKHHLSLGSVRAGECGEIT